MAAKNTTLKPKNKEPWKLVTKGRHGSANGPSTRSGASLIGSPPLVAKTKKDQHVNAESSETNISRVRQALVDSHCGQGGQSLLSQTLLQAIASDIPSDSWKFLFRTLMSGCPQASTELENIESNNCRDLGEQKFQALQKWLNSNGRKATVSELDKALRKHHCSSVADKHTSPLLATEVQHLKECTTIQKKDDNISRGPHFQVRLISVEEPNIEATLEGENVIITIPSKVYPDLPKTEEVSSVDNFLHKARVAVTLLDSIINPMHTKQRYKMELSDLARRFEEKYGSCFKFRQLGVGKLTNFIKQSCWFSLEQDGEVWYVKQAHPQERPSFDSGIGGKENVSLLSINPASSDSEWEGYATCTSPPMTPYQSTPFSTPPPHRKTKAQRNLLHSLTLEKTIFPGEKISDHFFDDLLQQPSGRCLKFVLEYEYQDQNKFTHDVVSMWNTPNRESSHIVVGVSPTETSRYVGLKHARNNTYYQSIFLDNSFSYKPPYSYSEILFKGSRYGVITIPSSFDFDDGEPCYAEVEDPFGRWHCDSICFCNPVSENSIAKEKSADSIKKWFKGKRTSSLASPEDGDSHDKWQQDWEYIKDQLGDLSHKAICSLIVSSCDQTKYQEVLGKFPWQIVWDFDQQGHNCGICHDCKDVMEDKMKISTWKDPVDQQHHDGTTDWVFIRGIDGKEDTMIKTDRPRDWFSKVKKSLNAHCEQLARECREKKKPLLVVILWYDNFEYLLHLTRLLEKIDEIVEGTKCALIMSDLPEDENQKATLKSLCDQFDIEKIPCIPLSKLCQYMYHCQCPFQLETCQKFNLPTSDGTFLPDINETDANWYGEQLDVLYTADSASEASAENVLGLPFLTGHPITWSECDLGLFDIKRSLYNPVKQCLMRYIMKKTSGLITILHDPLGGGTTFARRLLWDLHFVVPCVSIKSFDSNEVMTRLESLHEKTNLPILVLVDRCPEDDIAKLKAENVQNIPLIILNLQYVQEDCNTERRVSNQFYLSESLDATEAVSLAYVLSNKLNEEKIKEINSLVEDVKRGHQHCLIEFGLVAFGTSYKGVQSYVSCHLGEVKSELLPWQESLGYLALTTAYVYAQNGLPAEFFHSILGESDNLSRLMYNGTHLMVEDLKDATFRIKHPVMAKEILQQLLCSQQHQSSWEDHECGWLNKDSKRELGDFVKSFVYYTSQCFPSGPTENIMNVIYKLFFSPSGQVKSQPGTLLKDIDDDSNMKTDIEKPSKLVLTYLSQCFPGDQIIGVFL